MTEENLRKTGFAQSVGTLVAELRAHREVSFDLRIDEEATVLLSPEQSTETLQIAQEAISNSLRHGQAKSVKVRLHKSDQEVCLLVQDDGSGFDSTRLTTNGHGLDNIRARAARMGATVRIDSQPGAGARVIVTLPVLLSS